MVFVEKYTPTDREISLAQATVMGIVTMVEEMVKNGVSREVANAAAKVSFDTIEATFKAAKEYAVVALIAATAEDFARCFPEGIKGGYRGRENGRK